MKRASYGFLKFSFGCFYCCLLVLVSPVGACHASDTFFSILTHTHTRWYTPCRLFFSPVLKVGCVSLCTPSAEVHCFFFFDNGIFSLIQNAGRNIFIFNLNGTCLKWQSLDRLHNEKKVTTGYPPFLWSWLKKYCVHTKSWTRPKEKLTSPTNASLKTTPTRHFEDLWVLAKTPC